jgi:hypothetical protein
MWRWLLVGSALVVLLAVGVALALPYLVDLPRVRQHLAQEAGRALGRPVRFESLSLFLFPRPAIQIRTVTVSEDPRFGLTPFLSADEIRLRLRLLKLLTGQLEFGELTVDRPNLRLVQNSLGAVNLASLGPPPTAPGAPKKSGESAKAAGASAVAISEIRINDASVRYETLDRSGRPTGHYDLSGLTGSVNGVGSSALTLTGRGTLHPGEMAIRFTVQVGPIGTGGILQSRLGGELSVEVKDLALLSRAFLDNHPTLNGAFRGSLALSGTLGKLEGKGKFESASITARERQKDCPPPEVRSLALEHLQVPLLLAPGRADSRPMTLRVAGGTISLAGTLAWQPTLALTLREIAVDKVGLAPILSGYLCQGYAVDAPLNLKGDLSGPLAQGLFLTQLNGSGQLKIGAGTVIGPAALSLFGTLIRIGDTLSSGLSAESLGAFASSSSPLSFEEISATYTIKNGTITTQDLTYLSRQLRIRGVGSYRLPDQYLDFDVVGETSRGKVRVKIVGSAHSPSIRPSAKSVKDLESALQRLLKGLTRP